MRAIKAKNDGCLVGFDFTQDINLLQTVGQYGAPQIVLDNINKPTNVVTYTELLCFYGDRLPEVKYLELGCSFGKNFWQILNYFNRGNFIACDLESINPNLSSRLPDGRSFWSGSSSSQTRFTYGLKRECGTYFSLGDKNAYYMQGNLFSEEIYKGFPVKVKSNLIFSDALHDPRALPFEIDNLLLNDLIDDDFIIYYDDLHGSEMIEAFHKCSSKLAAFTDKPIRNRIFNCYGWIGEHEFIHTNGIITNTDVDLEWEKYAN